MPSLTYKNPEKPNKQTPMLTAEVLDSKKTCLQDTVLELRSKYVEMFLNSSPEFPRFTRRFSLDEQIKTETELQKFIDESTEKLEKRESRSGRGAEIEKLKASVKAFVAKSMRSEDSEWDTDFLDDFSRVGDEFVREARGFDSRLNLEDIHQALRNVWIISSLQVFLGKEVALTPSGFAYSLLYPYTDNYLDDPHVGSETKKDFVYLLGRRLAGESVKPTSRPLCIPFDLMKMIEEEYPRSSYPEVFGSLLAIHHAQVEALAQHDESRSLSMEDLLAVSVEKGGTSVLADGYVAGGTLGHDIEDFAFGFGVCLQLMDDLQDLKEDLRCGHETLMTREAAGGTLDTITNRLINFTTSVIDSGNHMSSPEAQALLHLSHRSCVTLILEAVARSSDKYTVNYLAALEAHSPLRFSYLKSMKENLKSRNRTLTKLEFTMSAQTYTGQ
jgi:hypothetical protein